MKFLVSLFLVCFSLSAFSFRIEEDTTYIKINLTKNEKDAGKLPFTTVTTWVVRCDDGVHVKEYSVQNDARDQAGAYCRSKGSSLVVPTPGTNNPFTRPSLGNNYAAPAIPQGGFAPAASSSFRSSSY
jgi:hypothetical protein